MAERLFRSVLVANRGEIAVRVLRTLRDLGIRGVAVYSEVDRMAPHVRLADEAYALGGATAAESYLNIGKLLDVARRAGCEAVHPGYGFLSENPLFAEAVRAAGLVFIGPPPDAMRQLGRKTDARVVMHRAGVPVVPGNLEPLPDLESAIAYASQIGFPVALKAVSGGGGKGMRIVWSAEEMPAAYRGATGEAQAAFGDAALYIEKYVERPRHVEIQFLADQHGNAVSLGERECSIQRRHQKVVEEAPSPAVSPELRQAMGQAAVRAALAVGYVGAGTAEFLLAQDGSFYFLEVNARLQVEHPVTEQVLGMDLVAEQVRIAAGEPLGYTEADLARRGWAIECRISAEDPANRFYPSTGTVLALRVPAGPGVRLDSGIEAGQEVTVYYDPLLAKLIVWGADRDQAIRRMQRALEEFLVLGVRTTIPFHRWLFAHPDFRAGQFDTGFLEREWRPEAQEPDPALAEQAALVAALAAHTQPAARIAPVPAADGTNRSRWRTAARVAALHGG